MTLRELRTQIPMERSPWSSLCSHPWLITASLGPRWDICLVPPADITSLQLWVPPSGLGTLIVVVVGLSEDLFRALELPEQGWVLALGAPEQEQRRGTQRLGPQSIPGAFDAKRVEILA